MQALTLLSDERLIRRIDENERDRPSAAAATQWERCGGAGAQRADAGRVPPVAGIGPQHVWNVARAVAQEDRGRRSEAAKYRAARGVHRAAVVLLLHAGNGECWWQ